MTSYLALRVLVASFSWTPTDLELLECVGENVVVTQTRVPMPMATAVTIHCAMALLVGEDAA